MEVENVLREIRERVRTQPLERRGGGGGADAGDVSPVAPDAAEAAGVSSSSSSSSSLDAGALARLEANLATTERTWNKLPPLMSYRRGWLARAELWLKRQVKHATHWYMWEQVNFNASVYHALRDALSALSIYEQHIAVMQRELASLRPLRAEFAARHAELESQLSARASRQTAAFDARLATFDASRTAFETSLTAFETSQATLDARLATLDGRWAALASRFDSDSAKLPDTLAGIVEQLRGEHERAQATQTAQTVQLQQALQRELRERVDHVKEEQRVCFKQLSLESSENSVLTDRARRGVESRIDELAARVEELRTEKERWETGKRGNG